MTRDNKPHRQVKQATRSRSVTVGRVDGCRVEGSKRPPCGETARWPLFGRHSQERDYE